MNILDDPTKYKYGSQHNQKSRIPRSNRWFIGFMGLIYMGLGLGCLVMGIVAFIGDPAEYILLGREGVPATGVITGKRHLKIERLLKSDQHSYYITYKYTAMVNGVPAQFESENQIPQSSYYKKYQAGQTIEILYAASDPQISAVNAGLGVVPDNSILMLLIGAVGAAWFGYSGLTTLHDEFVTQRGS
ncbi:DUF3592 domain-containing protein [Candidatus Villigracilis vicinus]|uniref:DUF3592 domain-containing protein n=1 Tax=Candidatus Villigracilis vicinus TaxID=3140679 RepID=UPI0031EEFA76